MAIYVKAPTIATLNTNTAWLVDGVQPATAPGTGDIAKFVSNSLNATLTGALSISGLLIEGAAGNITWNPTTAGTAITFNGTTAFEQTTTNNRLFNVGSNGQFALGGSPRTFILYNSDATGPGALSFQANRVSGTSNWTIENAHPTENAFRAYIALRTTATLNSFTGRLILGERTGLSILIPSGAVVLANANITVAGEGVYIFPSTTDAQFLGDLTQDLTISSNRVDIGSSGASFGIQSVIILGATKRTLAFASYTESNGGLTGTNGFIKSGIGSFVVRRSSTLSGTVDIEQGGLYTGVYNSGSTNLLPNVTGFNFTGNTSGTLVYYGATAFTENRPLTVTGSYASLQNNMNVTVTMGASSNIAQFPGTVAVIVDNTIPSPVFSFGSNLPAAANVLGSFYYTTTSATRISRMSWAPDSPTTMQGSLYLYSSQSTTGHTFEVQNTGTAPTTFVAATSIRRYGAAGTSSAASTLSFVGTNPATTTIQGNIVQEQDQGILSISKTLTGPLVFAGTNNLSGSITVSTGVLEVQHVTGLGAATSSGVTTSGTGQILLTAGGTYNKSATNFTIHATNPIVSVGNNILQTLGITLAGTAAFTVDAGSKLTLSPQGAGVISGAFGITKNGDGELELTEDANTFTGLVTVNAGTLTIGSVANSGSNATWGTGALGSTVTVSGTLKYTGGSARTTRDVRLSGSTPALDASGTAGVTYAAVTLATGAKTITLTGSNTNPNTIESQLLDQSGVTTLVKNGAGKWVLNGALSYSGTTSVNNGTLRVEATDSNTTSGAVTIGASGTVELVTNTLASSGAGNGEVLGTGNVTCNGGIIKTRGDVIQKGQVRYGGNLTFGAGSSLYIGAAA
jgi:fibronectin-binding autotransporter adhesin